MDGAPASERASSTVGIDNESVRVTLWRFAPGAATGRHRHEYDYVIVPLTDGALRLLEHGEERHAELQRGVAYFREEGVGHDVFNAADHEIAFVEVELKTGRG